MAKSKAFIVNRFVTSVVDALQRTAGFLYEAATGGYDRPSDLGSLGPVQPLVDKNGWSGDLFDHAGLGKPFSRQEIYELNQEVLDPSSPGNKGDQLLLQTQHDMLAAMERAFRLAHMSPVRAAAHAAARHKGQAAETGVLRRGLLVAAQALESQAKRAQG